MKIGIISDTHIIKRGDDIINLLETHLKEVDYIIHAGDYINKETLDRLKKYKNFIGVWGNVDSIELRNEIKEKEVITFKGYKIGIFHGHGMGGTTIERAYNKFKEDKVDIIIFGHSHQPLVKTKDKILMLNPGSITSKRKEKWYSYIILELHPESIDLSFKFINKQ